MHEVSIAEMIRLLQEARVGVDYAWEHYGELAAREHAYTLYGPHVAFLGASIPSSIIPISSRRLRKTTRRKDCLIYELDGAYKILRTVHMINHKQNCVYHHFELNGITYAYPFRGEGKQMYDNTIIVLKFEKEMPVYYAYARSNYIFAEFYEYIEQDRMGVSCYSFSPNATHTQFGYPVDWSAPIGAENSPVSCHYREEPVQYIDFSHWFEEK